jgi:translation initiation factor 2B subunit (eIF-2B alpha/beta/delta family)
MAKIITLNNEGEPQPENNQSLVEDVNTLIKATKELIEAVNSLEQRYHALRNNMLTMGITVKVMENILINKLNVREEDFEEQLEVTIEEYKKTLDETLSGKEENEEQ